MGEHLEKYGKSNLYTGIVIGFALAIGVASIVGVLVMLFAAL